MLDMTTFIQRYKTALFALVLTATAANAADATHGQHGMALFGGKEGLYASHLPLFHAPHDHQVILRVHVADPTTDAALRVALAPVTRDATVTVVAQRVSTIRTADRIVVLNHGRITEAGAHEELMRIEGGLYQRLYLLQQLAV